MEKRGGMYISCRKLFAAECYAWLTAKCVIEECLRLGSASGFAPTNAMELLSKFLENASLLIGNDQGVDGMDFSSTRGSLSRINQVRSVVTASSTTPSAFFKASASSGPPKPGLQSLHNSSLTTKKLQTSTFRYTPKAYIAEVSMSTPRTSRNR